MVFGPFVLFNNGKLIYNWHIVLRFSALFIR